MPIPAKRGDRVRFSPTGDSFAAEKLITGHHYKVSFARRRNDGAWEFQLEGVPTFWFAEQLFEREA